MMEIILMVVVGGFAMWGLVNPFAGLVGLLFVNLVQPGELYPIFNTLRTERVLAILVLGSMLFHRGKLEFPPITKRCLWLLGVMFCSVPLAIWRMGALVQTLDFSKTIIYHILIVSLVTTEKRFRVFLVVFTALMGWIAVSSFYLYQMGTVRVRGGLDRAIGLTTAGGDPNALGLTLVLGLPLVVVLASSGGGMQRLLAAAIGVFSVTTVVLTASRGSFYTMLFMLGLAVFTRRRRGLGIVMALLFIGAVWFLMPAEYQTRYLIEQKEGGLDADQSYQQRVRAREAGVLMFLSNPIIGIGAGQFPTATGTKFWPDSSHQRWLNAHSLYFQILGELGLLGALAFGAFLFELIRTNRGLENKLANHPQIPGWIRHFPTACNLCVLGMLFAGYAAHTLYRSNWYMLAGMTAALVTIVAKKLEAMEAKPAEEEKEAAPAESVLTRGSTA